MYELPKEGSSLHSKKLVSVMKPPTTLEEMVEISPVNVYSPVVAKGGRKKLQQARLVIYESQDGWKAQHEEVLPATTNLHNQDEGICIDAIRLSKVSRNKTILLRDISLVIPAGALVAVVGSSGAGKSTLLKILNGIQFGHQGQVYYNGYDFYQHASSFHKQLGYVPQDDIVHPNLTVGHALYYAAKLRLPATYTRRQVRERIEEVLASVGLTERRNLLISNLSGGQRKRVSIALELLDKPKVFFLDEPTSGLDPGLDYKMMHMLRSLANRGQTVVVSTHATSNIMICDYVCFLAPGGRLVYFGPPNKALAFFRQEKFEKIYPMLEASTEHPEVAVEAEARFKASNDYRRYISEPLADKKTAALVSLQHMQKQAPRRCGGLKQFWLLSIRYLELLKNDTGNLLILLLQAPVIVMLLVALMKYETGTTMFTQESIAKCPTGITVFTPAGLPNIPLSGDAYSNSCSRVENVLQNDPEGEAYVQKYGGVEKALQEFITVSSGRDAQSVLFIMSFTAVLFGCVNSVREIVKERLVYQRERAVHLGIVPYMFSKIIVLGILCLIQDAVMLLVISEVAPFVQDGIVFPLLTEVYITLVLTSLAGLMIGLAVSAIVSTTDSAMSFVPIILIPQVIFSGTVFPFKGWVTQILAMFFPARWSIGALGSTIGLHSDKLGGDNLIGDMSIYCGTLFSTCSQLQATVYLFSLWAALGAMILLFGFVTAFFLKLKDRHW